MLCHYCNYAQKVPSVCPKCGSEYLNFIGTGSEKVEEELHRDFPEARIARMDRDTVERQAALREHPARTFATATSTFWSARR